jgi:hypothetical protein
MATAMPMPVFVEGGRARRCGGLCVGETEMGCVLCAVWRGISAWSGCGRGGSGKGKGFVCVGAEGGSGGGVDVDVQGASGGDLEAFSISKIAGVGAAVLLCPCNV